MRRFAALAVTAGLLAVTACSTNYVPRSPGRVFVTMDGGKPAYVRDGRRYAHGMLGGGLREAVSGNREAERAADEYHDRIRDGLLIALLGGVCAGTAIGWAISDEANREYGASDDHVGTKLLVALGCTGLMFGGTLYAASAEPYRWDAINIFNDTPPPLPYPGYGPPVPGYYGPGAAAEPPAAKKRLGMRDE